MNNTLPLTHMDQAMKLKKIGFDWPVSEGFNTSPGYEGRPFGVGRHPSNLNIFDEKVGCISRPTIDLALMWLRDVKGAHGWVENTFTGYKPYYRRPDNLHSSPTHNHTTYGIYDEASSALLDEILKIVVI